jgi:hypothetical protein
VAEGWPIQPIRSLLVSEMSSVHLRPIDFVSHDVIVSWYVIRIYLTLVILILFHSPSIAAFLSLNAMC